MNLLIMQIFPASFHCLKASVLKHPQFIFVPSLHKRASFIKLNSVAFSPQANYTDQATATS
jgi:hypothetical protein